ncbi:DegT/DnrJ/EryC1/StrS family aminotransferase [Membranihabitans maritimus]|uniref:DegT/DnrJ/EryC1/StrS family aminotransferase n=1 Tax=Membranihabitans maritimus TaxID=2904244 RepID=UPI001EFF6E1C|nr:aminotransferase class I/II-fold pyridoxal phosphate-dependent enzyme [Membranihabitans maritimus]
MNKIWLSSPHMDGEEQKYVQEAFDSNWIAPLGPNVTGFEKDLEKFLDHQHHVAVLNSGTSALHLALILAGVESGDEVICQSMTFSASANPILYQGATPVFVDSEKNTWNLCPAQLERAIKDRIANGKKPKAIIAVHLYGMPYDAETVNDIAEQYEIPVIEDAAEALGSVYKGKKCGSLGTMAIYSFNGNKIITTSGGGAIITKEKNLKEKAVFYSTQSRDPAPHYQHSEIGYNYRMSNVVAGIGRGQMEVLKARVAARRSNYNIYREMLDSREYIEFTPEPDGYFSNRWLTTILTPSYEIRESIRLSLAEQNIESRPLWKPMHMQPLFLKYPKYLNGVSEDLFDRGLCLPSGSNLSVQDLKRVIGGICLK